MEEIIQITNLDNWKNIINLKLKINRLARLKELRKRWISTAEHKLRRIQNSILIYKLRKIRNSILIYKLRKNRALILIYVFYFIEDYRLIIILIQNRFFSRKRIVFQNFNNSVEKSIAEAEIFPNNNNRIIIRRVK
jgi:hypothetical protein